MTTDLLIITGPGVVARRGEAVLWAESTDLRHEGLLASVVERLEELAARRISPKDFARWLLDELAGPRGSTIPALAFSVPVDGEVLAIVHGWGRVTAPGGAVTAPGNAHRIPANLPIAVGRADLAVLASGDSLLNLESGVVPGGAGLLSPSNVPASAPRHSAGPAVQEAPAPGLSPAPAVQAPTPSPAPAVQAPAGSPVPAPAAMVPAPALAAAAVSGPVPPALERDGQRPDLPALPPEPQRPAGSPLPVRRPGATAGQPPLPPDPIAGAPLLDPPTMASRSLFGSHPIETPPPAPAVAASPPALRRPLEPLSPAQASPAPPAQASAPSMAPPTALSPAVIAPPAPPPGPPAPAMAPPTALALESPLAPPGVGGHDGSLMVSLQPDPNAPEPPRDPLPIAGSSQPGADGNRHPAEPQQAPASPRSAIVSGVQCARQHFNNPTAMYCRICGISLQQGHVQVQGERPSLGVLVCDDGATYGLDGDYAIGADPRDEPGVISGLAQPLVLGDGAAGVAPTHVIIHLDGWEVLALNRSPGLPAAVLHRGDSQWTPLVSGQWARLAPGSYVGFAGRHVVYENNTRV